MTTEFALRDWRFGQTQAERLCAELLSVEGFESIDPQAPLGGPDGKKDILCQKDGEAWLAAVYFPATPASFSSIRSKFVSDCEGVEKNGANAFAFFVNQHLTIGERAALLEASRPVKSELFHLERLRTTLDSPKGYGLRLKYLHIPMTVEEQSAFISAQDVPALIKVSNARSDKRFDKIELLLARTMADDGRHTFSPSSVLPSSAPAQNYGISTVDLNLGVLCWVHRLVTDGSDFPQENRGRLRGIQVWIGTAESPKYMPPPPEDVHALVEVFLSWWREMRAGLVGKSKSEVVTALAEFHHRLLSIHPFLDANGRVARALLDQAARELLNKRIGKELTANADVYFNALKQADCGELSALRGLIEGSLRTAENWLLE